MVAEGTHAYDSCSFGCPDSDSVYVFERNVGGADAWGQVASLTSLDTAAGESPQTSVQGGSWMAAEVSDPDGFSLLGCTVAPGFEFADFELAGREDLADRYPEHRALIERMT